MASRLTAFVVGLVVAATAAPGLSQGGDGAGVPSGGVSMPAGAPGGRQVGEAPEWLKGLAPDPSSPESKRYAAHQKTRRQVEKDLRKLRATYFRGVRSTEMRQLGLSKLGDYTDAAVFPTLLELFEGEGRDVEDGVLDHLRSLGTDEADATLAWAAVFGRTPEFRAAAAARLKGRVKDAGKVTDRVKWPVSLGLRDQDHARVATAAGLADGLDLVDAIPMLINAQVVGSPAGAGGGGAGDGTGGALAYIMVAQQEAFVAGLTPVVGDNAVAFDPRLGVITTGAYVRVIDAVVVTYRTEVNSALIALSTRAWGGQSTASLGWDQAAWRKWYAEEFTPYRRAFETAKANAGTAGEAGPGVGGAAGPGGR